MIIRIDNKEVEVRADETLFQIARRLGKNIPSMCFVEGAKHHSSCMVCMVKNEESGQMIPSCSTYPGERGGEGNASPCFGTVAQRPSCGLRSTLFDGLSAAFGCGKDVVLLG